MVWLNRADRARILLMGLLSTGSTDRPESYTENGVTYLMLLRLYVSRIASPEPATATGNGTHEQRDRADVTAPAISNGGAHSVALKATAF